jgi:hypothetical protein
MSLRYQGQAWKQASALTEVMVDVAALTNGFQVKVEDMKRDG